MAVTGKILLKYCEEGKNVKRDQRCVAYILGVLDTAKTIYCPKGTYEDYLNDTVILYLKTTPEALDKSASEAVIEAIKRQYKCETKM
jgi:hypothetical protein